MPLQVIANTTTRNGIVTYSVATSQATPKSGGPSTQVPEKYSFGYSYTNNRRSHVCDFTLEMKKDLDLGKYTRALANTIREAIRKLLLLLGGTDSSGVTTFLVNTLKNIARSLRDFNKYILKPITDFLKSVVEYIATLRAIIAWILSLPAKLAQLLSDCLERIFKLIRNIFVSIVAEASAVGTGADPNAADADNQREGNAISFTAVINEARDVTAAVGETLTAAKETAVAGAAVAITAVALFEPATAEEADSATSQALDAALLQSASSAASSASAELDTRKNSNPYDTANQFSPQLV